MTRPLLLAATLLAAVAAAATPAETHTYILEHSLTHDEYVRRATVVVSTTPGTDNRVVKFRDALEFGKPELQQFKALVDREGVYRIRIQSRPMEAARENGKSSAAPWIYAAIPACQLQLSKFQEQLTLHMDRFGNLASAEYSNPSYGDCSSKELMASVRLPKKRAKMRTSAVVLFALEVDQPPTRIKGNLFIKGAGIDGKEAERKAKEAAAQPGFLRRYWYIIVPVGIMVMLSNAVDPEALERAQAEAAKKK
jgi:hypothetical protein